MPKDFYVDYDPFDPKKRQPLFIRVEEDILYSILSLVDKAQGNYLNLREFLAPLDDSVVSNKKVIELQDEIIGFLIEIGEKLQGERLVLLLVFQEICVACVQTGQNIYGISD